MKKFFGLLLALCMLLSGVAFAETAEAPALQQELVVLFTSDVHCGIDSGFGITSTWLKQEDGSYVYSRVSENFLKELQWWRELQW